MLAWTTRGPPCSLVVLAPGCLKLFNPKVPPPGPVNVDQVLLLDRGVPAPAVRPHAPWLSVLALKHSFSE